MLFMFDFITFVVLIVFIYSVRPTYNFGIDKHIFHYN